MSNDYDFKTYEEDYRARVQEIQQIVSQRFQLTSLAILVFSATAGWLTTYLARLPSNPQEKPNLVVSVLLPIVSIILISIIFVLYYEYFALLRMLRVFTTSVRVKFPVQWEEDWEAYRKNPLTKKYPGYSRSGFWVFLLLAVLSVVYPLFYLIPYRAYIVWQWTWPLLIATAIFLIAFILYLCLTHFRQSTYINEEQLKKGWRLVLKELGRPTYGEENAEA